MSEPPAAENARWLELRGVMLARGDVVARGMMGYPCLWRAGEFFAGYERASGSLVVKLAEERCIALLEAGEARPFRPRGTPFRQWVVAPPEQLGRWAALLDEAYGFAGG